MAPCKVDELWRFPVKSMGGERLECGADGVVGDRRFAVRDLEAVEQPGLTRDNRIIQTIA